MLIVMYNTGLFGHLVWTFIWFDVCFDFEMT
jgi:hypothetical protein